MALGDIADSVGDVILETRPKLRSNDRWRSRLERVGRIMGMALLVAAFIAGIGTMEIDPLAGTPPGPPN